MPSKRPAGASRRHATAPGEAQPALPARGARIAGGVLAVITAALAASLFAGAAGEAPADAAARIVAGALLAALALGIGALAAFPAAIRDRLTRR